MPRFTRSSYITVSADGVRTSPSTGPRVKFGWLAATLTLKTADGGVSDPISLTAGGMEYGTGAAHAFIKVPRSMSAVISTNADGSVEVHIVQTPNAR